MIRYTVLPDYDDMASALNNITVQDNNRRRMWVFEAGFKLPNEDLERIATYANQTLEAPSKSAVVCADDLGYGLLRILEAHRDQEDHTIRVFRNEIEARTWLELPL